MSTAHARSDTPWFVRRLQSEGIAVDEAVPDAPARHDLPLDLPVPTAHPTTSAQVTHCLREAATAGYGVAPVGGGRGLAVGPPPERPRLLLSLDRMASIVEHFVEDHVVRVEAGCTLSTLQSAVEAHGQWLALETPEPDTTTVGGLVGAAPPSLLAASLGNTRLHLIGVRAAHSDGRITKSGGEVVKNVAGYDLGKLYHGAMGTLVVLLDATFRLRPRPVSDRSLCATLPTWDAVTALRSAILHADHDDAADPAAVHAYGACDVPPRVSVRVQGDELAVEAQVTSLHRLLEDAGGRNIEVCDVLSRTAGPRDGLLGELEAHLARGTSESTTLLQLSARPSHMTAVQHAVTAWAPTSANVLWDVLRGTAWVRSEDGVDADAIHRLRNALAHPNATLSIRIAPPDVRRACAPVVLDRPTRRLMEGLRQRLDPAGVLSPGRLAPPADPDA